MQILTINNRNFQNRLGTHLIRPKWRFWNKKSLDSSSKKFGSAYAQSLRKCSNIEILAKIEEKEAKFLSKIYEGHIRIWFRSNKNSQLSHACVPLKPAFWSPSMPATQKNFLEDNLGDSFKMWKVPRIVNALTRTLNQWTQVRATLERKLRLLNESFFSQCLCRWLQLCSTCQREKV